MFKMKKILSMLLAVGMIVGMGINAFAFDTDNIYMENVIYIENGIPKQITKSEYLLLLSNAICNKNSKSEIQNKQNINDVSREAPIYFSKFIVSEKNERLDYSGMIEVTPIISGGEDGATVSIGESYTHTSTFSISLNYSEKQTIISSLGFEYVNSASNNKSFGSTFSIGPGKRARVVFIPMKCFASGDLQHWVHHSGDLDATLQSTDYGVEVCAVKKVGRYADGLYELRYV